MFPVVPIALGYGLAGLSAMLTVLDPPRSKSRKPRPPAARILEDRVLIDDSAVVSVEEVPLDNRLGREPIVSEHEFSRTASNSISFSRNRDVRSSLGGSLLSLVKAEAELWLGRKLGCEIGARVTRSIKLRLTAAPGTFARYRITWKQDLRRGRQVAMVAGKKVELDYVATHGLCHEVTSLAETDDVTEEATRTIEHRAD